MDIGYNTIPLAVKNPQRNFLCVFFGIKRIIPAAYCECRSEKVWPPADDLECTHTAHREAADVYPVLINIWLIQPLVNQPEQQSHCLSGRNIIGLENKSVFMINRVGFYFNVRPKAFRRALRVVYKCGVFIPVPSVQKKSGTICYVVFVFIATLARAMIHQY